MNKDLIHQLILLQRNRAEQSITKWRSALRAAEDLNRPRRSRLQEIYDEILLDAHINSEMQKRVLHIIGRKGHLINTAGEINPEATELLSRPWFEQLIKHTVESSFRGTTLLQMGELVDGELSGIKLIPRAHHVPEIGHVIIQETDESGIDYRNQPEYWDWLIEIGDHKDLGILNQCVPHALYKRYAAGSWSEFNELFVMPLRVGKTNTQNNEAFRKMEDMMIEMAQGAWAVIDKEEEIEFIDGTKGNKGESFQSLITHCNSEISKIFTLAVIGEASQGGSRSKEEVGERLMQLTQMADERKVANIINYQLLPRLEMKGYPVSGLKWKWEKSKDISKLWDITNGLLQHKDVDNDWLSETFEIPVSDKPAPAEPLSPEQLQLMIDQSLNKKLDSLDPFL